MGRDTFWDIISTVVAGILRRSVHALVVLLCTTHCHYRAKQTWESVGTHFSMQMLRWEKCVCVRQCDSYSDTHHTSNVFSEAYFKHSPRLSVCALVMSTYALVFSILLLICLSQDLQRMKEPTKQHIWVLMCIDFIRVISHMAQEYKYTPVITRRVQEADHIHIIASCSAKKKKKKKTWENK